MTTVDDREAIARTLAQYCHTCDDGRFDALGALFAEDAELVMFDEIAHGREAIRDALAVRQPPERRGKHMTANAVVTIDGDTARAESDFVFYVFSSEGRPRPSVLGRYLDVLTRTADDDWCFARREIAILAPPAGRAKGATAR